MAKKKKINIFLKLLLLLFIIYLVLYIVNMSGYYESKIRERTVLTEQKIKEFDELIQNGENVDIDSFLDSESIDYSNGLTHLGDNVTRSLEHTVNETSKVIANILKSLF